VHDKINGRHTEPASELDWSPEAFDHTEIRGPHQKVLFYLNVISIFLSNVHYVQARHALESVSTKQSHTHNSDTGFGHDVKP
jgi:hypothetical protein